MKVHFKTPVKLDKFVFKPGIHEIPDEMESHWFLKALVQNNKARILSFPEKKTEAKPVVEVKSVEEKPKKKAGKKPKKDA